MGKWAKALFGKEKFGEIGIVIAGATRNELEKEILGLFDEVISSRDKVYHAHLAKKKGIVYPVVSNVYGASAMVDVLTEMHDGGCRIIIFVGSAYGGFKNLEVGTFVLPNKSYHFEGIYHPIGQDRRAALPDKDLKKKIGEVFNKNGIKFVEGANISVPAVTFQLPHANEEYKKLNPLTLEMEFASCLSRAKEIGIRAAGILVISDNKNSSIGDEAKRNIWHSTRKKVLKIIIENIAHFKLPPLPTEKEFSVDEHLAKIIEDPEDVTNVYRKK